jgi:oxalate---CoA ligase
VDSIDQQLPATRAATSIAELIARKARRAPEALAILAPGRVPLTFGGLRTQIDATIASLAAAGFGRGDRIALVLPDGPELAVALLAVTHGATCVPLNPALDEVSYGAVIRSLRIDALIVLDGPDTPAVRAARTSRLPILRLAFASSEPAGAFTLVAESSRPAVTVRPPAPEDIALVLQTSGTTATPKAVPQTHRQLTQPALTRGRNLRLTSADRCLCVAPLFSSSGIRRCLFPVLVAGGSLVCTPGLKGNSFLAWLDAFRPTFYTGSPAVHRAVLDELERRGRTPGSSLRFVVTGSAALPASVQEGLERVLGVPVLQGYGMTETGTIAQNPLPPRHRVTGSVGLPLCNEFAILGDDGAFLAPGTNGEIVVRGPEVFDGYEDDADSNARAFFEGWFKTGDLGYVDSDGRLYIVGRVKELINRGGFKVSPSAVDAALMRHPGVVDAAAFAVPHATLGEDLVAAAVVRDLVSVTAQELRDFAFEHLPAFMVPSQIVLVPELRRTPSGKLPRAELATLLRPRLRAEFSAPRGHHEELVAGLFARVLGAAVVGAHDNFFEIGGDSLRGAQVVIGVNATLDLNLDVATLFRRPTVAQFAAELTDRAGTQRQSGRPPIEPLQRSAPRSDAAGGIPRPD